MIKTVELTGSEVKVTDLGGQNAAVKNLGSGSIYVSTKPNITAGADNVIEIPAGAGEVVLDTNGTVYIVGTGKVQCTGTPYATPNFKLPSSSSGGGGGTSDVTKEYVDAQDTTNLNLAKAYTDNAKSEIQTTIDTVNDTLNTHIADQVKHITAEERAKWDAKADTDTATTTADGLMSAADKEKLDGVAANANKYSLPLATASVRGGVKIGYEENGKNYPVELANEKMFVNVPWENTTYTNFVKSGSGAKSGLVPAPSTTAGTTKYLCEDGTWTVPPNTTYSAATSSNAGLMSSSDKEKLDGVAKGATKITVDSALSTSSTNPVQNKIVTANLGLKANIANPTFTGSLSQSRRSGETVGKYSVTLGADGTASAAGSIAAGGHCIASETNSISMGYASNCPNVCAQTLGMLNCSGSNYELTAGKLNKISSDAAFCLGYGSLNSGFDWANKPDTVPYYTYGRNNSTQKNIFRVNTSGTVYGVGAYNTSGADYAEYIKEWADGNPEGEDRRGYLVTVKDGKLCKAESGDYIVGITSGNPSIIGNADEDWLRRWQRDEFNSLIYKEVEVPDFEEQVDENGNIKTVKVGSHTEMQTVENPDYDKTLPYVERKDRPEWSAVGMIGILPLRDDGTCETGGFAKCGAGGIATKADTYDCHSTFFVVERISENVISVEMR